MNYNNRFAAGPRARPGRRRILAGALSVALALSLLTFVHCSETVDDEIFGAPLLGGTDHPRVVTSNPLAGAQNVSGDQVIALEFNKPISASKCPAAFALSPSTDGFGTVFGKYFTFSPNAPLPQRTYRMTMTKGCEDHEGRDLVDEYNAQFAVGLSVGPISNGVQAVGLESQGCPTVWPGGGSAVGGNHTLGSCWWDDTLPVLTPSAYKFLGGDDGLAAATSCVDRNTDNIRVIFNRYMDPNVTIGAISLTRLSPPIASTRLSTWTWSDCQGIEPFGCRVVTLVFAEDLATCNGTTAFGAADFNLAQGTGTNFPFYQLDIDTTAADALGNTFTQKFSFGMEGE
ncbi:MAG: Ig-like domain-containing protein [Leptospirales bacterium]